MSKQHAVSWRPATNGAYHVLLWLCYGISAIILPLNACVSVLSHTT